MRILFVCENYLPHIGGAEIVFKNLAEGLVKKGHQVKLVTHQLPGTKRFEVINDVPVHRIPCFDSRYLFTFFSLPKIFRLAKEADIIHTTTFNGAPPAWLISRLRRKPCLLTVHEVWVGRWAQLTEMKGPSAWLHSLLERFIYLFEYDQYACVSSSTKKQLDALGIAEDKSSVVYNGIDYRFWNPRKYSREKLRQKLGLEKNFVYLFYGRPGTSKGLDHLIKAVPLISNSLPSAKLLLMTSQDSAYQKKYCSVLDLIKKLKIQDNVLMLDPVPYSELPSYVRAADCVVVPSLAEGFGFVAAESCALGVPVVASQTASLPEVVSGKYILVKPKDSEALAESVKKIFVGHCTKSPLKKFEIKKNIEGYLALYRKLTNAL